MLKRIGSALVLALLLTLASNARVRAAGVQTYVLDPVHTQIVFFADHLGFSHGIGRLKVKQGWFQFDNNDWSTARVDVVVDMQSLDMGDAEWTKKVGANAFLDSERWPTAHFIGNSLEKETARSGILHGDLWLRGIRHAVDLAITFNRQGNDPYAFKAKAGFSATATLDRFDFGMKSFRDVVAGPVELRIEVEGIRNDRRPEESTSNVTEKH